LSHHHRDLPGDRQPVLDDVESVKRYVYGVAHQHFGNAHAYAGPTGFTPAPVEFFPLLDRLIAFVHDRQLPVDTKPLRDFGEVELRRLLGTTAGKGVVSSGLQLPGGNKVTPGEWLEKAKALDDRLNDLKARLPAPGQGESRAMPWSGPEWDALQGVPRRLLEYMNGREESGLTDELCRYVWGEDATAVTFSRVNPAIHRANEFLGSVQYPRTLAKAWKADRIVWTAG
jgi:hypothetical protein